jgi:uncharacterized metal-binding protein
MEIPMSETPKTKLPDCAACTADTNERACMTTGGIGFKGCPTLIQKDILKTANTEYQDDETLKFARQASIQEGAAYANRHQRPYIMQPCKTRIEEIWEFSQRMGFSRIGLAFCLGLRKEAAIAEEILDTHGLEIVSACCKAGCTSKELIQIEEQDKVFQETDESMCNPIFQAMLLNEAKTDFNVLLGLCVGHDSLFFKYAQAPTTVLAVKDRLTGHNPLAAIYQHESYFARLKADTE